MFNTVKTFFREDPSRLVYLCVLLFVILMIGFGCSVGKVAFQAEDVKVEKPYSTP